LIKIAVRVARKNRKSCNIKFLETAQNIELHIYFEHLGSCKKKLQKLALIITVNARVAESRPNVCEKHFEDSDFVASRAFAVFLGYDMKFQLQLKT